MWAGLHRSRNAPGEFLIAADGKVADKKAFIMFRYRLVVRSVRYAGKTTD